MFSILPLPEERVKLREEAVDLVLALPSALPPRQHSPGASR
jgi:hypothetical protein